MKKALLSVWDKTGIGEFAGALVGLGFEIISTGSTYKTLVSAGIPVTPIEMYTGFPEMLDGRLKTLHPKIHGGLLSMRDNPRHMQEISAHDIYPIDIVVNNLYPFKQTISKPGVSLEDAIENIDIGGPSMLRASAKNYRFVTVVCDPADYPAIIKELTETGRVSVETNFRLSAKVFMHTAHYDAMIANYLKPLAGIPELSDTLTLTYEKTADMRYGENPHQKAAFYKDPTGTHGQLTDIVQLHGKELSFNNINDTHGALELLREFDEPTVVACKHGNPCGVGSGDTIYEAYTRAYTADPVSIFGGILVLNREVDAATAKEINGIFIEIVLAPSFSDDALAILRKKKNIRLLTLADMHTKQPAGSLDLKKVSGGILVQDIDSVLLPEPVPFTVCTKRKPTEIETADLKFMWRIVKYVKSNGIAIGKNKQSLGIGCGQVNRIWATKQAIEHCTEALGAEALKGAVLASDAFFPMPDCVEAAHAAGITAIIQPGGSIKDNESIEACDRYDMAMVFTNMRHFRH